MKSNFMDITAKIIAEIRTRTCIDAVDAEVLEELLKDELIKYHNEVFTYGHNIGYDDGYAADNKAVLDEAVDNAYDAGYALGYYEGYESGLEEAVATENDKIALSRVCNSAYYDGHSDGYSLGYDDGYSDGHSGV